MLTKKSRRRELAAARERRRLSLREVVIANDGLSWRSPHWASRYGLQRLLPVMGATGVPGTEFRGLAVSESVEDMIR